MFRRRTVERNSVLTSALLGLVLFALSSSAPALAELDEAQQVKLAFLYNFAKFVTWPEEKLSAQAPILLCVGVKPSVFQDMAAVSIGRQVAGRSFEVRPVEEVEQLAQCHILYLDERYRGDAPEMRQVAGGSVLTVGDARGFSRHGVVGFYFADNKLRFEINVDAARRSGLTLSSRLLALAKVVYDE